MPVSPQDPSRGVLDFPRALRTFHLDRRAPSPCLSPWIESYWEVVWNLPEGTRHRQTNLSHASVNVVIEPDGTWIYGVPGPTFVREIFGEGRVFGVKFHAGAFFPWYSRSLHTLYDRRVRLLEILALEWEEWAQLVRDEPQFPRRVDISNDFWQARRPELPGKGHQCAQRLIEDRSLHSVEESCLVLGQNSRSLQRLFKREVGLGPKEVLQRYRLMEAAERLAKEPGIKGANLANDLGYSDQAHFIRAFKIVTGFTPYEYRRRNSSE